MTTLHYAQAIYQRSLQLPEVAAREALDFIEFLQQRYATPLTPDTEQFLAALAGGWAGDFPDDIDGAAGLTHDVPRDTI
jgi:hypothetical protein